MKFSKLALVSVTMFLLSFFMFPALAEQKGYFVHALFSTDKPDPLNRQAGNYVRMRDQAIGDEMGVVCLPYSYMIYFDSKSINEYHYPTGKHEIVLDVCSDAKCTQSTKVADDVFMLTKDGAGNYYAAPETYSFAFSGYYPAVTCEIPRYKDKEHKLLMIRQ